MKHCLLVVDDEPDVADSVHDLLRREFRVLKANGAEQGLQILRDEEVHIIMTDQRMPSVTGVDFLTRAQDRMPQAIRMLYTGFADMESVIAAINHGHIYQFLRKPWQPEELLDAVRSAAAEYDRLVTVEHDRQRLKRELDALNQRVSALEAQVQRLGGSVTSDSPAQAPAEPNVEG